MFYNRISGSKPMAIPGQSDGADIGGLKADFVNKDSSTRAKSAESLIKIGKDNRGLNKGILDFFIEQSGLGNDTETRCLALIALFRQKHVVGICKVVDGLSDSEVCNQSLSLLAKCTREDSGNTHPSVWSDRAYEPLVQLLNTNSNSITRGNAAIVLGITQDARAGKELIGRLADEDKYVRLRAVWALGEIGTEAARKAVVGVLNNKTEDTEIKEGARNVLSKLANPVVTSVQDSVSDSYPGASASQRNEEQQPGTSHSNFDFIGHGNLHSAAGYQQDEYLQRLQEDNDRRRQRESFDLSMGLDPSDPNYGNGTGIPSSRPEDYPF